ncbi:Spore germination protein YaaH [Lachnospiraceae bacterium C7]|nr:Spore germination protein YaaH [Lachnospiraceae bacterium C7]
MFLKLNKNKVDLAMKNKISKKTLFPALAILFVIVFFVGSFLFKRYSPSHEKADVAKQYSLLTDAQVAILLDCNLQENQASLIDGSVYLDYSFLHDHLNARFYWDSNENKLIYTTASDLIMVSPDSKNYDVNRDTKEFKNKIVILSGNKCYVNIDFAKKYSTFTYKYFKNPARITVTSKFGKTKTAISKHNTEVRVRGGIKSPIMKEIKANDSLFVISQDTKWTKVMTKDGIIGYIKSGSLSNIKNITLKSGKSPEKFKHLSRNFTINMAWHQVTSQSANSKISSVLSSTKGVNVISPTWFYVNDNNGNIKSLASTDYVNYCHKNKVEVWALVSNLENPNIDSTYVLTHTSTRQNLVNQIVSSAIQYNLDGINIDFESLNGKKVGDSYIQFIRELSLRCKDNHIVLSVDNYVPSAYTAFYNRKEQSNFADYICVMAYDEHTTNSDEAGSTASLPWVKKGIKNTLKYVPKEQIIMGVPLYTRLWSADSTDDSELTNADYKVNKTCGISSIDKLLNTTKAKKKWLKDDFQYYIEYQQDNTSYKMWIEDNKSLNAKLNVVTDNQLAGAAFWKLGFENDSTWAVISKKLK